MRLDSLAGTWRGTSTCTPAGKPACHDEVVVYHFKAVAARDSLEWVMNKVVDGKEDNMATLTCSTDAASATMQCPMRDWMWTFHADARGLHGTLVNASGTVWRNIEVSRQGR